MTVQYHSGTPIAVEPEAAPTTDATATAQAVFEGGGGPPAELSPIGKAKWWGNRRKHEARAWAANLLATSDMFRQPCTTPLLGNVPHQLRANICTLSTWVESTCGAAGALARSVATGCADKLHCSCAVSTWLHRSYMYYLAAS